MLLSLLLQVLNVDVTILIASNDNDLHTCHRSRCGVGTVCRRGAEDNVTIALTAALVVCTDDKKARVLTCSTSVRLECTTCKASDCCEVALKVSDKLAVTLCLILGSKGVNILEASQRQGLHELCSI